ncbi:MAG TPA: hypothetical protein ENH67_15935 [Pseudoalteromonas sp.]|nr:hypothetical protein PH505_dz00070 [Pseudoalteromonas distincta]HDY90686.1 hypothetical protein [Pseudoalteromonas sp.]HDZ34337.1 hypothetical protein [Pseudoalteromonas sp.]
MGNADLVQCKININFTFIIWLPKCNKVQHFYLAIKLSANKQILAMVLSRASKNKKHRTLKALN